MEKFIKAKIRDNNDIYVNFIEAYKSSTPKFKEQLNEWIHEMFVRHYKYKY